MVKSQASVQIKQTLVQEMIRTGDMSERSRGSTHSMGMDSFNAMRHSKPMVAMFFSIRPSMEGFPQLGAWSASRSLSTRKGNRKLAMRNSKNNKPGTVVSGG